MSAQKFNLFSFTGKMKILHLSWMVFFISFFVWFNLAPLLQSIAASLGLTKSEIKTLLILNVALTIPARIIIGMLTDLYGPRKVYSALLIIFSIPCFMFAFADSFQQAALARFLLGGIGAGFAFTLPTIAILLGGEEGWRYAIALTGMLAIIFGILYFFQASDTPKGSTYFKAKQVGAMEVTSKKDLYFLLLMKIPLYAALALLTWKLSPEGVSMLSANTALIAYIGLTILFVFDCYKAISVNKVVFKEEVPEVHRYKFKQVAVLNILYFATFGSELAVVSMLPLFFAETFELTPVKAGMVASAYAFMNLMSRPGGGWISDRFGRKSTLLILTAGLAVGYFLMSLVDSSWALWLAVVAAMVCSFFVQAGEGAVFAVVPLIKRRLTGQIAGMTGAYGNVGAVTYLTIFSLVDTSTFFLVIASTAVLGFVALLFLEEPSGTMAEVDEDGNVQLIDVT